MIKYPHGELAIPGNLKKGSYKTKAYNYPFFILLFLRKNKSIFYQKKASEKKYVWLIIIEADDYNKGRKKKKEVLNKTSLLKAAKGFRILEEKINEYFKS